MRRRFVLLSLLVAGGALASAGACDSRPVHPLDGADTEANDAGPADGRGLEDTTNASDAADASESGDAKVGHDAAFDARDDAEADASDGG